MSQRVCRLINVYEYLVHIFTVYDDIVPSTGQEERVGERNKKIKGKGMLPPQNREHVLILYTDYATHIDTHTMCLIHMLMCAYPTLVAHVGRRINL